METVKDSDGNVIDILPQNEMGHAYSAAELLSIPKMAEIVKATINFLGKADKGFFMMYEQGDIDWAAHADHMECVFFIYMTHIFLSVISG